MLRSEEGNSIIGMNENVPRALDFTVLGGSISGGYVVVMSSEPRFILLLASVYMWVFISSLGIPFAAVHTSLNNVASF